MEIQGERYILHVILSLDRRFRYLKLIRVFRLRTATNIAACLRLLRLYIPLHLSLYIHFSTLDYVAYPFNTFRGNKPGQITICGCCVNGAARWCSLWC